LVDSVEGIMPQTETVIRQALKERVRPVLFINKVDRLVNELKISPDMMQQRFQKIITEVNNRIRKWLPEDLGEKWMVNVEAGSGIRKRIPQVGGQRPVHEADGHRVQ